MGNPCCTSREPRSTAEVTNPLAPGVHHTKGGAEPVEMKPRVRDQKHIFEITFSRIPLGVIFTSSTDGTCTYVTGTDGNNDEVSDKNLPTNSKVLKVNDVDVELQTLEDTTELLKLLMKELPITITFCLPDGLDEDERQDPDPLFDYTKVEIAEDCQDLAEVQGEASPIKGPVRDEEYVFDIIFTNRPLGIVVNCGKDAVCAYVTVANQLKNPDLKDGKLPMFSKVLRVNGIEVEMLELDKIVEIMSRESKKPALTITFCHPDGLGPDEVPDMVDP